MSQNVDKLQKYIVFIVSILCITLIIFNYNSKNKARIEYENFLMSKYDNIPIYTKEELDEIPEPEHPHLGSFQNLFETLDPELGYVPSERLIDAYAYKKDISTNDRERSVAWSNIQSNMGGRTRTLMYDPNDLSGNKVWAAGVSGGLWYNNDISNINSPWVPVNDFWDNLSVSKIIYDPNNTNIFYVSTGEANTAIITYRESSARGVGIWKTLDGGLTWTIIESTSEFAYITDIEIGSINNQSYLYAAVVSGTYQGIEHQSIPNDGLYVSNDGGYNWTQTLPNIDNGNIPYSPSDIEINANGKVFVGTMKNLEGNGGAVILMSDNGIDNWQINNDFQSIILSNSINNIPGRIILSSSYSNPNIVYGVIGSGYLNNMNFNLSHGNYIIKTINSGNTWNTVNLPTENGNEWASLAWHALAVSVHPDNPDIVFIGGLELYRTMNGGETWTDLSEWDLMYYGGGDRYVHADIHQIVFNPINSNIIAVTSDGGNFYSENATSNNVQFIERNKGYNTLQFYTCDILDRNNEYMYVGGLQDNGTLVANAYNDTDGEFDINDMITGGDGAYCFFDKDDPIVITSTYYNAWYIINYETNEYEYVNNNSGVFINPSDYDSENNIIYANKVRFNGTQNNRIIKISDDGDISTINLNTNTSVYFSSVKVSPYSDSNTTNLFLGTQSGRLYKVNNVNTNPSVIEIGDSSFPFANVSSISIGINENEIFVTFSNYGISSIWYTNDGGVNWNEKEANLPDLPVRWGLLHPNDSNTAIIATELGVWETGNLLSNNTFWNPSNNGMGNVRVDMLQLNDNDNMIVAASHGRGLYYGLFEVNNNNLGDINNDNFIDVLDAVLLINIILDSSNYNEYADINNDSIINVLDVVLLVNIILDS